VSPMPVSQVFAERSARIADPDLRASARQRGGAVPSLDLLRSYAIFSVVTFHTVLAFGAPAWLAPLQIGVTGVDLFFVLSGWLLGAPTVFRTLGFDPTGHQTHVRYDECAIGVALAAMSVFRPGLWSGICRYAAALAGIGGVLYSVNAWGQWHPRVAWNDYNPAI